MDALRQHNNRNGGAKILLNERCKRNTLSRRQSGNENARDAARWRRVIIRTGRCLAFVTAAFVGTRSIGHRRRDVLRAAMAEVARVLNSYPEQPKD